MSLSALIVDDEKGAREILTGYLPWNELGVLTVEQASDGEEALKIVETLNPNIIISDIKMPHMNGIDFARCIRSILPHTKFVFLSGYPNIEYLKDAIKLKAARFIEKPINIQEITQVIQELVHECNKEASNDPKFLFYRGYCNNAINEIPLNSNVYVLNKVDFNAFSNAILNKNRLEANAVMTKLFSEIRRCEGTDLQYIRHFFCRLALQFINAASTYNISTIKEKSDYLLYTASNFNTLNELEMALLEVSNIYFDEVEKDEVDLVTRVNLFLQSNYTQSSLTLQEIASNLGFVHTYLCNAYKKGCGKTINQTLNELRISAAKELLINDRLKLCQVAKFVGYNDAKYFNKVFYKKIGLKPKEYRERHCYEDRYN